MIDTDMPVVPGDEELSRQVRGFGSAECVFLSGSVVAGFGHPHSDIDVYVCLRDGAERDRLVEDEAISLEPDSAHPVHAFYVGRRRWDVEYVVVWDVEALLSRVERTEAAERSGLTYGDVDLLYRVSVGRPVKAAGLLAGWQRRIARSNLRELLKQQYLTVADGLIDDALGLLAIDDVATAAHCARQAFEGSTDALLAASGRFCPSPKWRIAQLRQRPAGPVDVDRYLAVTQMRGYDGRPWVEAVIDTVRDLAFEV